MLVIMQITKTATFTIEDTTDPVVTCDPQPETHECTGLDGNRGAAELWNQTNINALIACSSDECGTVEVTSDFDYANLSDDCGLTGEITVTYTVTDECDNTTVKTATFTVIDTTDPTLGCDPDDLTFECDGVTGNQATADQWNAANIAKLIGCALDNCQNNTINGYK